MRLGVIEDGMEKTLVMKGRVVLRVPRDGVRCRVLEQTAKGLSALLDAPLSMVTVPTSMDGASWESWVSVEETIKGSETSAA